MSLTSTRNGEQSYAFGDSEIAARRLEVLAQVFASSTRAFLQRTVVQTWGAQLRPGGLLLLEETEWIQTSNRVFAAYLETVAAMLESQSTQLYVGQDLDRIQDTDGLERRSSDLARLCVPSQDAA